MSRLEGVGKLNRRLNAIRDTRGLLRTIQLDTVAEAKKLVPRKTSHLGRSISPGSLGSDFAIVQATAGYAAYVELGTRPHVIRPRSKKVLAWSTGGKRLSGRPTRAARRSGAMAFARLVHHPGTKPQPYLVPGAKAALGRAGVKRIIENWNRAA
jgi:hypothetical protein